MNYKISERIPLLQLSPRGKTLLLTAFAILALTSSTASPLISPPDSIKVTRVETDSGTYYIYHEYMSRLLNEAAVVGLDHPEIVERLNNKILLRDSTILARETQLAACEGITDVLNDEVIAQDKIIAKNRKRMRLVAFLGGSGWFAAMIAFIFYIVK